MASMTMSASLVSQRVVARKATTAKIFSDEGIGTLISNRGI